MCGVRKAKRKVIPEGARAGSQTTANAVLCGRCLQFGCRLSAALGLAPGLSEASAKSFFLWNKVQSA